MRTTTGSASGLRIRTVTGMPASHSTYRASSSVNGSTKFWL
ncbi:hypothetical protein OHA74_28955 [Streptomyces phaeochromogenes]|nr:hypothetical protein [Streptomyces phaeochromogenes]